MSIRWRNKTSHTDVILGGIPYLFSRTRTGLTPQAPSGSGTTKYLREDGTWQVPPDNNTTKGNGITTYAAKTGSGTTITSTIAANTTMDNAIGTLLNNDVALNNALSRIKTAELLVDTYPSAANTFQTKSLSSGKKFSDYVLLLFIFMQYNNHFATALEPTAVFKSQTGTGNRLLLYTGSASNQSIAAYYVSDTSFALAQGLAGDGVWHTRIYGIVK